MSTQDRSAFSKWLVLSIAGALLLVLAVIKCSFDRNSLVEQLAQRNENATDEGPTGRRHGGQDSAASENSRTPHPSALPRIEENIELKATEKQDPNDEVGTSLPQPDSTHDKSQSPKRTSSKSLDVKLSDEGVSRWQETVWADCHTEIVVSCKDLIDTFRTVLKAPENTDDGWSEWMEGQIRASLSEKARDYESTKVDVKCAANSCVFILYANSAAEIFGNGWQYINDFDLWLREQHWNDWLEVHANQRGQRSTLQWRVVGSLSAKPFINWYVVTRKD
jgi:hypothetical protein